MLLANKQINRLEAELSEIIGTDGVEVLRKTLRVLITHTKKKSANGDSRAFTPLA
jgi:hypothetical protein